VISDGREPPDHLAFTGAQNLVENHTAIVRGADQSETQMAISGNLTFVAEWKGIELEGLVLHSGRLTLRPWQAADAVVVEQIMADEHMHHYLKLPNPYDSAAARQFVSEYAPTGRATGSYLALAIAENTTGRVVGAIGLDRLAGNSDRVEIGYWVAVPEWGKGFASEATQTLARFALANGARRVQIVCDVANAASAMVALNSGFRFEGVHRSDVDSATGPADAALFARLLADSGGPVAPAWPTMTKLGDAVVSVRPMMAMDWPTVLAEQNNPESLKWSLFDRETTEEQARLVAASARLDWLVGSQARLVICDAVTGAGAGTMVLRRSGPPDVVGIGYGVLPEFRGRRFTTRALDLVSSWAFEQTPIARLELGCKVDNVASARAAELAGFVREGIFAGRLKDRDGGYSDEIRYGRTRSAEK
jgi:RimJ/RimL family protein N-acetyltransferase